jgi:hypothetical protein
LRYQLLFTVLLLTLVSCNRVHEELPSPEPVEEIEVDLFSRIDSLYLAGEFETVRDSLLMLLSSGLSSENEILIRILGLYHGRAMEDEFVLLLDSLELAGSGQFTGWKVSALDLAGTPERAIEYVFPEQPYLYAWLSWEIDSLGRVLDIPEDPAPGELFSISRVSPPGSFTSDDLVILASCEALFPSVRNVLLRELAAASDTAGPWILQLLENTTETPTGELIILQRYAEADSGSLDFWEEAMFAGGEACSVAVEEILQRYPGDYTPRWKITDMLIDRGWVDLALTYSERGDISHRTGTEISLLLQREKFTELLELISNIPEGDPDSLRARAALFRARALKAQGSGGSVYYPAYLEFATLYPWHPEARESAYNAGKYFDCEQEWSSAAGAYLTSLRSSGSWEGDERAYWRGGFSLYMSGRLIEAESLWSHACGEWPAGYWRDEMLFWRARLAGELGKFDTRDSLLVTVSTDHPWEYYGMLAAQRLGGESDCEFSPPEINLFEDEACSLALELTSMGFGSAAVEMLSTGSIGSPAARSAALSLMGRHGSVLRLLRSLDAVLRDSANVILPDSLLCFYFPSPYADLAISATDTLALDADVLQGIMREESYFDRWVVSSAGAIGVVQLMPGTAYDVARWYGLPFLEPDDFFDPSLSVPYGALYIDRQQSSFNGQIPLFLAAYNAGPGNASRWVDMHGWNPDDPELYIEQITYRETRMYVKKVQRSAWIYERR